MKVWNSKDDLEGFERSTDRLKEFLIQRSSVSAKGSASIVTKQRLLPVNQNLALEREENELKNSKL